MSIKITLKSGTIVEVERPEDLAVVLATEAGVTQQYASQNAPAEVTPNGVPTPKPKPKQMHHGGRPSKVNDPETVAKVFARRNEGMTIAQIAKGVGLAKSTVQRIIAQGGLPKGKEGNGAEHVPVTKLVTPPGSGRDVGQLTYEAAAAVEVVFAKKGRPVSIRDIRKEVTKGTQEAIGGRLGKAVEMGLIQRTRAAYFAPNSYKTGWEHTAMTKEAAERHALPLVKFMTEHPDIQERSELLPAATKAGVGGTPAAVGVRLWAAKGVGFVEGTGHPSRGGTPYKVTEAGLEAAARDDGK